MLYFKGLWEKHVYSDQQVQEKQVVSVTESLYDKPQHSTLFGNYDWQLEKTH